MPEVLVDSFLIHFRYTVFRCMLVKQFTLILIIVIHSTLWGYIRYLTEIYIFPSSGTLTFRFYEVSSIEQIEYILV